VITTNSQGNAARHLIQHGVNGSVVPLSPKMLARAIDHWISVGQKPDTAAKVAESDWRNLAKQQAEVYMS